MSELAALALSIRDAIALNQAAALRALLGNHPDAGRALEMRAAGNGETALMLACRKGSLEMVRLLLGRGAQPNRRLPSDGQAAIHYAAWHINQDLLELLGRHGADLHQVDQLRRSALHIVATHPHGAAVALWLCEVGLDIDAQDSQGRTPLMHAVLKGHADIEAALLARGANPYLRDRGELTALQLSQEMKRG